MPGHDCLKRILTSLISLSFNHMYLDPCFGSRYIYIYSIYMEAFDLSLFFFFFSECFGGPFQVRIAVRLRGQGQVPKKETQGFNPACTAMKMEFVT